MDRAAGPGTTLVARPLRWVQLTILVTKFPMAADTTMSMATLMDMDQTDDTRDAYLTAMALVTMVKGTATILTLRFMLAGMATCVARMLTLRFRQAQAILVLQANKDYQSRYPDHNGGQYNGDRRVPNADEEADKPITHVVQLAPPPSVEDLQQFPALSLVSKA